VPLVAVNVAVVAPEATVRLAGTVTAGLLLESVTAAAVAAAFVNPTVQVDTPPLSRAEGVQLRVATWTGALRFSVVERLWPLSVAVTAAV
jgi:hypothetical protein